LSIKTDHLIINTGRGKEIMSGGAVITMMFTV